MSAPSSALLGRAFGKHHLFGPSTDRSTSAGRGAVAAQPPVEQIYEMSYTINQSHYAITPTSTSTNHSTHIDTLTTPSTDTTHTMYHKDHARHNNTVYMIPQTTQSKNHNKHQALINMIVVEIMVAVL